MVNINLVIKSFTDDIMSIIQYVMDSEAGINNKAGHNTLKDSRIYRDLQVKARDNGDVLMDIILNDYIIYIESGRRPNSKFPPVEPIVEWCRRKGLPTDNGTVFLIRRAIARDGIRPRPILDKVFEYIDQHWDRRWADKLFNAITEELDRYFN